MIDDLEQRLRAVDPCPPDVPVERADTPSALALMGSIMNTDSDTGIDLADPPSEPERQQRRRVITVALGAAAVTALLFGGVALFGDSGDDAPSPEAEDEPVETATFVMPSSDPTMQMCLPVADAVIPPGALAFAGTVISIEPGGSVTMDVDRWYTTGEVEVVKLESGTDVSVALDGVEFVVNEQYLVTVIDRTVAICGISGPVSPELERLYEQWYG